MQDETTKALENLSAAIKNGLEDEAEKYTRQAIESGIRPLDIVKNVLVPTLAQVGQRFQNFEIFLPELMLAGEAGERVTAILEEETLKAGQPSFTVGTVVIGQVAGDLHDIGRNIVTTMLKSNGYKVIDLGHDVPDIEFVKSAEKEKADIVALSALMTTTLPAQQRTIHLFEELGKRARYRIIVGGGAVSAEWAETIHADGYASDAAGAVELCNHLMKKQPHPHE